MRQWILTFQMSVKQNRFHCSFGWGRELIFWDTCLLFWYINPLPALFKYNKYYLALTSFLNELSSWIYQDEFLRETGSLINSPFRASLHGGGGPQVGKVTRLGEVTRLTIKFLILFWSRLHVRWGDPQFCFIFLRYVYERVYVAVQTSLREDPRVNMWLINISLSPPLT